MIGSVSRHFVGRCAGYEAEKRKATPPVYRSQRSEELDYNEIARQSCSTAYHFQRMFGLLCGYTLLWEDVQDMKLKNGRQRRLFTARSDNT